LSKGSNGECENNGNERELHIQMRDLLDARTLVCEEEEEVGKERID
jgi:hypothetical protein